MAGGYFPLGRRSIDGMELLDAATAIEAVILSVGLDINTNDPYTERALDAGINLGRLKTAVDLIRGVL